APSNARPRSCPRLSSPIAAAMLNTRRGVARSSTAAGQLPAVLELWQSASRAENLLETLQATEYARTRTLHHACRQLPHTPSFDCREPLPSLTCDQGVSGRSAGLRRVHDRVRIQTAHPSRA